MAPLFNKGYPLKEILIMLDEKYIEIVNEMEKGRSFEEFIPFHKKDAFYNQLKFFMSVSSMSEAIEIAASYESMHQNHVEKILKQISYPLFVLGLAIGVFFMFELLIYPKLMTFVQINQETPLFFTLTHLFLLWIFLLCFIFIGLCLLLHFNKHIYHQLFDGLFIHLPLVKSYISFQFAKHLLLFMKKGYSTRQILQALCHLTKEQPLRWLANDLSSESEMGEGYMEMMMKHNYLSKTFKFFFKINFYAQNLMNGMEDYLSYQQNQFLLWIKQLTTMISLFAYSFIAILVALIYQILLTPLEMITMM